MYLEYVNEDIKRAFANKFLKWGLLLEDSVIDSAHAHIIRKKDWEIRFIQSENEKGKYLEFYAISHIHSDEHFRIYQNGIVEMCDVIHEGYSYDPSLPGNKEIQRAEYLENNKKVYEYLKNSGLYRK